MDRSLGHPHSMGQGAFLASTTANVPIFWVEYINIVALNLHRKPHKITSKGSWVIWERVYFGAQTNFLDSFPRLLCIADGINLIFKCRIQWKALDTLNICKNLTEIGQDFTKIWKRQSNQPSGSLADDLNLATAYHPRKTFPLHSSNHERLASKFERCLSYMLVCWKSKEIKEFKGNRTNFWTYSVRVSVRKCMSQGMGVPEKGSRFGSVI